MAGLFNQHFWKFLVGFIVIMSVGFFYLVWANNYHVDSEQKSAEQYLKDLKRAYDEDTYGGKTPEETLSLFISALKKGDIDLAAKYFVIEEQENIKTDLEEADKSGDLSGVVQRVSSLKLSKKEESRALFSSVDSNNILQYQASLVKAPNGIWKIRDL